MFGYICFLIFDLFFCGQIGIILMVLMVFWLIGICEMSNNSLIL